MNINYISCASNYQERIVDWAKSGDVCYGYSNSIAIYDPEVHQTGKVLKTFHSHSTEVKVVQWIENDSDASETKLLSGSLDGTIIIWSRISANQLKPNIKLDLGDKLTTTHGIYMQKGSESTKKSSLLVCASSFKSIFKIWRLDTSDWLIQDEQTLDLKKKMAIDLRLAFLPGSSGIPIVIAAFEDATIHLFAWNTENKAMNFLHATELKGQEHWIQCLDYTFSNEHEALLASGSQDRLIRLWKISIISSNQELDETMGEFIIGNSHFGVSLESVLSGHEHWVYGLHWHPPIRQDNGEYKNPLKLLSCALDSTIIIWEPDYRGTWIETVRMGQVGGNSVSYYGCKFNADGSSVLAHGYQGTIHMWKHDKIQNKWLSRSAPSGHFSDVNDLHWEARGRYLITTSSDKTTRIHIPWNNDPLEPVWHEIARPQVHGYDINCISMISSTTFVSGADEKVVRIFEAPAHFAEALEEEEWTKPRKIINRTSALALGLTNKAVEDNIIKADEEDYLNITRPPTEEEIIRHTVWPETRKLYGHGYEIFSINATHNGNIIATACKSTSAIHSAIILWSTTTWAQIQQLSAHRLTVTQLEFSPNDQYLVSVSRDRKWALYCEDTNAQGTYALVCMTPADNPVHTRIIWCCAWTADSKYFATGSREGKIGLWSVENVPETRKVTLASEFDINNASITALNFLPEILEDNVYVLAIGVEDGNIEIRKILLGQNSTWLSCVKLDTSSAHHKTVKRLEFRPGQKLKNLQLASCSSDKCVKIYQFDAQKILYGHNK